MVETINVGCDGAKKWHWYNVTKDLVEQGGLKRENVSIGPLSVSAHGCGGIHKKNNFYITWMKDKFLMVSSNIHDQELIDAFAKIVEYKPFAEYVEPSTMLPTTEWDKNDPEGRFQTLQNENKLTLTRLLE